MRPFLVWQGWEENPDKFILDLAGAARPPSRARAAAGARGAARRVAPRGRMRRFPRSFTDAFLVNCWPSRALTLSLNCWLLQASRGPRTGTAETRGDACAPRAACGQQNARTKLDPRCAPHFLRLLRRLRRAASAVPDPPARPPPSSPAASASSSSGGGDTEALRPVEADPQRSSPSTAATHPSTCAPPTSGPARPPAQTPRRAGRGREEVREG